MVDRRGAVRRRNARQIALDQLDEVVVAVPAQALEKVAHRCDQMVDDEEQRLGPARSRDANPLDALGTGVVKLGGEHREVVLPAQTVEQCAVTAPGRVRCHNPVVKDGDAHGDQL